MLLPKDNSELPIEPLIPDERLDNLIDFLLDRDLLAWRLRHGGVCREMLDHDADEVVTRDAADEVIGWVKLDEVNVDVESWQSRVGIFAEIGGDSLFLGGGEGARWVIKLEERHDSDCVND